MQIVMLNDKLGRQSLFDSNKMERRGWVEPPFPSWTGRSTIELSSQYVLETPSAFSAVLAVLCSSQAAASRSRSFMYLSASALLLSLCRMPRFGLFRSRTAYGFSSLTNSQ